MQKLFWGSLEKICFVPLIHSRFVYEKKQRLLHNEKNRMQIRLKILKPLAP